MLFCGCTADTVKVQWAWDMRPKNKGQIVSAVIMSLEAGWMFVFPMLILKGSCGRKKMERNLRSLSCLFWG